MKINNVTSYNSLVTFKKYFTKTLNDIQYSFVINALFTSLIIKVEKKFSITT